MQLNIQSARDLAPGQVLKCHVVAGLELHARAQVKSWKVYYRANGVQRRPKIGNFPAVSIEAAREGARALLRRVANGEDPSATRRAARAGATVAELAEAYLAAPERQPPHRSEEHTRETAEKMRRYVLPALGRRKIASVGTADINALLTRVARTGARGAPAPIAANRLRALLSNFFNFVERADLAARPKGSNPVTQECVRFPEFKRRRFAATAEALRIPDEMAAEALTFPRPVAALWCILYSGSRVTELITARKSQREGSCITLREHKTARTGDERVIVLPSQALEIIDALPDDRSGLIFGAGLTRHIVHDAWARIRKRANCPGLQVRDFRRTFASAAKSAGTSVDTVGELFGHRNRATTDRYAWLFDEARDAAAQATADAIDVRFGKVKEKP